MGPVSEAVAARPTGPLRNFVREHHGYRQRGIEPAVHRGMPSPYLTVIFTLDEPLQIARHPTPGQRGRHYDTLVGGLHSSPALVVHDGAQSGIQLEMSPLAARPLLGLPAGELAHLDVPACDVLGPLAAEVHERLQSAPDWPSRFAVLDAHLGGALTDDSGAPPEVHRAWAMLLHSGGTAAVADIAHEIGWSTRYLAARFAVEIGLSPKVAARVIRFHRARHRLVRQARVGRTDVAGIAADCGYFDQAHLVRDWQQFTGLAPTAWVHAEFRNFQASSDFGPPQ